ncbi:hypothetical protein AOQ87_01540 [Candidatus Riesia pediculischaeffi]|uniref:phosphatidylserine decarboxylase n=2 Tax=Candidatus Riesia pediculischaeffi TaxID=428411 RepID=A0A1V0HKJ3_9ENTR|nr:hypothetical protein AOQ87_01540 [Candidatus Riesia pediculischaeffi]
MVYLESRNFRRYNENGKIYTNILGKYMFTILTKRRIRSYCALLRKRATEIVCFLANREIFFFTQFAILIFVKLYKIETKNLKHRNLSHYKTFNDFFSRKLEKDARKIIKDHHLSSPVDGTISEVGTILKNNNDQLIKTKGNLYSLKLLTSQDEFFTTSCFGSFVTIYLSPRDYHRVHSVSECLLTKLIYVPGELFSVNPKRSSDTFKIFTKNERMVCFFKTDFGKVILIMVGSILVNGIETRWNKNLKRNREDPIWTFENQLIPIKKGEEIGYFRLGGSTVICLLEKNRFFLRTSLRKGLKLQVGEVLAYTQTS